MERLGAIDAGCSHDSHNSTPRICETASDSVNVPIDTRIHDRACDTNDTSRLHDRKTIKKGKRQWHIVGGDVKTYAEGVVVGSLLQTKEKFHYIFAIVIYYLSTIIIAFSQMKLVTKELSQQFYFTPIKQQEKSTLRKFSLER